MDPRITNNVDEVSIASGVGWEKIRMWKLVVSDLMYTRLGEISSCKICIELALDETALDMAEWIE